MRVRAIGWAVALAVGVSACGGGNSYPSNVQQTFLKSCQTNSSASTCGCILKYLQAHVSLSTFSAADQAIRQGNTNYPSWLISAVTTCTGK